MLLQSVAIPTRRERRAEPERLASLAPASVAVLFLRGDVDRDLTDRRGIDLGVEGDRDVASFEGGYIGILPDPGNAALRPFGQAGLSPATPQIE